MGEWRGTLSFLASAPSSSCGCTGNTERSPAACSCLPPASSPARSVLPALAQLAGGAALLHFGSLLAQPWLQMNFRSSLVCFSFCSSWNSSFRGAIKQALKLMVRNLVQVKAVSATGRWHAGAFVLETCSGAQLNKLLELVSRAATTELQVTG